MFKKWVQELCQLLEITFFLFDSPSKDEIGRKSATCTTVLLKLDSLQSKENYMKSACYSNYPMTLNFRVQPVSILSNNEFCEEQPIPYLFRRGKWL